MSHSKNLIRELTIDENKDQDFLDKANKIVKECRQVINGEITTPSKNGEFMASPKSLKKYRHGTNTSVIRSGQGSLLSHSMPREKHFKTQKQYTDYMMEK